MKVIAAQFIFESNTFNPVPAELELFTQRGTWLDDEPAVRRWCEVADSQLAGSLRVLEAAGAEVRPVLVAMCGTPAGRLSAGCFRTIRETLHERLRAALPADAMVLHLHGAACAVGEDDVEGNLLDMVRTELGFAGRLVVSLDLHANITRRMAACADAFTAYRTMPHTDFRATGERAARLALDPRPTVRALVKIAVLIPPTDTHDASGRFAEILRRARALEAQPGVLDASVFPVQPWLDVSEMGTSVLVTAVRGTAVAEAARALAETWYAQRREWRTGLRSWDEIRAALHKPGARPWMLVDSADATTAGSSGASAEAVAQLWAGRDEWPGEVLLWVVDAAACAGAERGEKLFRLGVQRFPVEAEVIFSGEGRFRARGGSYTGQEFSMGRAVVLAAGKLRILVSNGGVLGADPAIYECAGLAPEQALAVQVKSLMGWRSGYGAGAEQGLSFDGPGSASLNFARLPFTGARRELFPINPEPSNPIIAWQSN
jgi:microcystin degradation protein MlrC